MALTYVKLYKEVRVAVVAFHFSGSSMRGFNYNVESDKPTNQSNRQKIRIKRRKTNNKSINVPSSNKKNPDKTTTITTKPKQTSKNKNERKENQPNKQ